MYQHINLKFVSWIATAAQSRTGLYLVGSWAIAEATFWFVAPDFILGLMIALVPMAWKRLLGAALVGSLIGGIFSFMLNLYFPVWMTGVLSATPFVQPHMIAFVEGVYRQYGYYGVLFQAFSFMQFKIWTQLAVQHGFSPVIYFGLVMVSRALRFGVAARLAKEIGSRVSSLLLPHAVAFSAVYTLLFLGLLILVEGSGG